jgi:outer membrane lipoprotein
MPPHAHRSDHRHRPPGSTRACLASVIALALLGCATDVPKTIRDPSTTPVDVAQVQAQPGRHLGQRVRWGGTIIAVHNKEGTTEIEVLARPLGRDGEPAADASSLGRFFAEAGGFLDPAEYPKDRELTVVGIITGVETRPVGDYPYTYPVVRVESRLLWPEQPPPAYPAYPWPGPWYDPWYGPFGWPYSGLPRRYRY